MSQIKQLLRLHQSGWKIKTIARELGVSKNTVKAYLQKVQAGDWKISALLALDDPALEATFHAGNPAYKDARYQHLKDRLDYYATELGKTGVTKQLLWEEYKQDHPDGYGRTQFCDHLLGYIRARKPSMVLHHEPADKLYIDFAGKPLSWIDKTTGEEIECQVFVACLPYSDYGFAMAVASQKVADFIHALDCCLQFLGGVPRLIVPDNLKSAIIRADKYEPDVNRALEDLANHYQTNVLPARPGKPKDKALVENHVKLVYARVYARLRNQQFFSLAALNQAIAEKMSKHNQTKMQERPLCRERCFISQEQPLLGPLPQERFQIKYYREHTVGPNNHIKFGNEKHYYSVPYRYIGKKVKVIYTRTLVRIYHQGEQIATHATDPRPGVYTTVDQHMCSYHRHYLKRSPDYYLGRAKKVSPILHTLFGEIFSQDRHPEQLYGSCEGLLSIYRKMGPDKADKACQIALDHHTYSYRFILTILKNNMIDPPSTEQEKPLPAHDNIRGENYYK